MVRALPGTAGGTHFMMRKDCGDCQDSLPVRRLYCVHQKPASRLVGGGGGVLVWPLWWWVLVLVLLLVLWWVEVVMLVSVAAVGGGVVVGANSRSQFAGAEANFMHTVCREPRRGPEALGIGSGCSICGASY